MHAHHIHGRNYFDCRGSDAPEPCRGMVREDRLYPWAERLFIALDAYRPENLAEVVAERRKQPERQVAPGALAQLDAALERATEAFVRGWWTEDRLLAERDRLGGLRIEIEQAMERPQPTALPLGSPTTAWS